MDSVLDDVARVVASPMTRREAFVRVSKILAAAVIAGVVGAPREAAAANCGTQTCNTKSQKCCTTGASPFCAPMNALCCGNHYCNQNEQCFGSGSGATCSSS